MCARNWLVTQPLPVRTVKLRIVEAMANNVSVMCKYSSFTFIHMYADIHKAFADVRKEKSASASGKARRSSRKMLRRISLFILQKFGPSLASLFCSYFILLLLLISSSTSRERSASKNAIAQEKQK